MPGLVTEILADYGTIPQKISLFLKKRNGSTVDQMLQNTSLTRIQVVHGLSLMIQRRLVKYFQYEKKVYYVLDVEMVYRRTYYAIYCRLIEGLFGENTAALFMKILTNGFTKPEDVSSEEEREELVNAGMVISVDKREASVLVTSSGGLAEYMARAKMEREIDGMSRKNRRTSEKSRFYVVDFGALDAKLVDSRLLTLVRKRYSSKAEMTYRSILRCNLVTVDTITDNLEGETNISREDVASHVKYFSNCGLLRKSLDCTETYFKDGDDVRRVLVVDSLGRILSESSKEARRIFSMILEHRTLEDKDIVTKSLVPSYTVKKALMMLHLNGFVVLKHSGPGESRPVLQWEVDIDRASRVVSEKIKKMLERSWSLINQRWRHVRSSDDVEDEADRELDCMLGLSLDLFVLGPGT
ncbi:hypothetical protein [Encephalitozoon cuniculi GB-M1]|uniref:DNA-directed RNA polymerase III subunit RPC3 n=1 Tax=Encephalitozoon cuniculi (strain GB-M1) TaxID=284813 RepID=Q8STX1_ENCCU|nr:uncharacterized protein ECU09_0250 [Encephalitozoon cuniculi GB-M1]CAD26996.1 hypothetical protein [Encephalitozoon cuniculi GB-M1]